MSALLTKLKWLTQALILLDEAATEIGDFRGEVLATDGVHLEVEYGWLGFQRYLAPEIILIVGRTQSSERRGSQTVVPLYAVVPALGFKAEIAGKEGPGILQDLVDDLLVDEKDGDVKRCLDLLHREVARSSESNLRSKCLRILSQLGEAMPKLGSQV